ncbi:transferase [Sinomonas halotolerans]|uniref:Transferase n=1 Tax=Sinomonas halotolerans TaxID=1644133 RepID=A0ABU9WWI2_9MICC
MTAWLILGASGHGRSLASIIRGRGERVAGVCDAAAGGRAPEGFGSADGSLPQVFTDDAEALAWAGAAGVSIAIGIGDNRVRAAVAEKILADAGLRRLAAPLVAGSATVDATARLGALAQVAEHAHVGPLASIGEAAIVNTGAIVEHDAVVGRAAHIAPKAAVLGAGSVGELVLMGSGACVLPGVSVGDRAVLGAAAVAARDLDAVATYVGVPARRLDTTKGRSQ